MVEGTCLLATTVSPHCSLSRHGRDTGAGRVAQRKRYIMRTVLTEMTKVVHPRVSRLAGVAVVMAVMALSLVVTAPRAHAATRHAESGGVPYQVDCNGIDPVELDLIYYTEYNG